jgi:3-hydroxyisobutyrate dehydrogenase-like beta-hydroxyacid dehydrogenase
MDESVKMAEKITQDLKIRVNKAKRIQKENTMKGKVRENHSADQIESPYTQHFRVSSSEKDMSLMQRKAELVSHQLSISK